MPTTALAPSCRACSIIKSYAAWRACSHISVYAPMLPPTMLFSPPRIPWAMVGARTVIPRTTPRYSRMRRPCTSKVVETRIEDWMPIAALLVRGCCQRLACAPAPRVSSHRSVTTHVVVSPPSLPAAAGPFRSLIGKKLIMAVTGLILFFFVVGPMLGNLKVFQGPEHFNAYAEGLRAVGAPFFGRGQLLWGVRIILLVSVLAHIWAAIEVTRAGRRARPVGYRRLDPVETTYAARTMRWGGVIIFLYVIYHLHDLTFGRANPSFVPGDVYHNVVATFSRWPVSAIYVVAMVVVGLHVYHGLWSAFQTLGWNRPPTFRWRRGAAAAIAAVIAGGYISIPVAVLAGLIR